MVFQVITIEALFHGSVLKFFAKFSGKYLCRSLTPGCNFNKKETRVHMFFCQFYEILSSTNFVENLQKVASAIRSES